MAQALGAPSSAVQVVNSIPAHQKVDITDPGAVNKMAQTIEARYGRLDVAVLGSVLH